MLVWILIFSGDALFGGLKFNFKNSTYYASRYPYYMARSKCKHCHIVTRWESLCSEFHPSLETLLLLLAGTSRAQINQVDIVCISPHLFSVLKKNKNCIRNSQSFKSQFTTTEEYHSNEFLPGPFDSSFPGARWIQR